MAIGEWTLDTLTVGSSASFERCVEAADVDAFARLSGDANPLHVDADFAKSQGHRDRVVHGALLAALVSQLIGVHLPGRRSFLLSLKMDFVAPTYPGDTVVVSGSVKSIHPSQGVVMMKMSVTCGEEVRARGSATVRVESDDE